MKDHSAHALRRQLAESRAILGAHLRIYQIHSVTEESPALGDAKGYDLVGCCFTGTNAFFVRKDLTGDLFSKPFTADHHYRECRYDSFVRGFSRHAKAAGSYEVLE